MLARLSGQKLIIIFGIFLMAGLWFSVWQQLASDYRREFTDASREEMNLARVYEDHLRRMFQGVDRSLLALRAAYQEEGVEGQTFQTVLNQIKRDYPQAQISIVDEHGILRSLLRTLDASYEVSDRDYFAFHRNLESDRLFVGQTILSRQSREMLIPLSRHIFKSDASFGGILVIAISPAYLIELFKDIELGSGKLISVTGMDGFTRIRQGMGVRQQDIDVRHGDVYQNALLAPTGTVFSPNVDDGVMRLNAYRVLPDYYVYVNVAMSEHDVLRNFVKLKYRYVGAGIFASLFILGFCGLMIKNNLRQQVLENQIRDDAKRLADLQKTTSRLVTDFADRDSLLQTIVDDAISLVGASNGTIATIDPGGQKWTIQYGTGIHAKRVGEKQPILEGLLGDVIRRKELVYVEDYSRYSPRLKSMMLSSVQSVIALPLIIKGEVIGVLAVDWTQVMPQPGEAQLHTFRQYASLASVALERAQTHDEIYQLAYTDALTGLPNRISIQNYLGQEMEQARRGEAYGAVLFIDLDNLKLVNDTMGHSCGDRLIMEAGRHICENAGDNAVVGRLAGDEFVVILPRVRVPSEIAKIADKLILSLDRQYKWEALSVHVSASAGVVLYPENGATVEDILKNADAALYAAKTKGKRSWQYYNASVQRGMHERMVITDSLHQALSRNELLLHYQPILSPEGILVGFEALLRWNSPEHGSVPPSRFIPIAEQDGRLMRVLGTWVLREACIFAKRLVDMGCGNLRVAVNVSARQLESDDFEDIVLAAIDAANINSRQLGLEITESVFMESVQNAAVQLTRLREKGINVSLDDFGEGYSSLTQLSMLPVDTLKISRVFTNLLDVDKRHVSYVCAIVNMAQALGLTIVAEGVETQEQLRKSKECGCDWIQGYYFYRPLPEEEAIRITREAASTNVFLDSSIQ